MDATEEVDGEHLRVSGVKRMQRVTSRREVEGRTTSKLFIQPHRWTALGKTDGSEDEEEWT